MPAGQGKNTGRFDPEGDAERFDAERFNAAVELGRPLGSVDADLSVDLEIVAMLRSQDQVYSPLPDAKARAKQRLMAVLAAEQSTGGAPTAMELTAPLGRLRTPLPAPPTEIPAGSGSDPGLDAGEIAAEVTVQMAVVADPPHDEVPVPEPAPARPGRRGRHTMPSRPAARPRRARSASRGLRGRAVLVGSAALVAMMALAGAGMFVSRDALPGDSLYALKRASESAGLALTFDEQAKALRHLEVASTRLDEVEQLVARQPGTPADTALLQSTMEEFDSSTGEGSRILLGTDDASGAPALGDLQAWAAEQVARLSVLRSALPLPAVADADDSIDLLDRLLGRAGALEDRSDCTEVTSDVTDELGRMPAEGTCTPRPADPTAGGDEAGTGTGTGGTSDAKTDPGSTEPTGPASPESGVAPGTATPQSGVTPGPDPALPDGSGVGTGTTTATPPAGPGDNLSIPVPLPLLPPITLPPLLPGLPGVTIG